MRPARRRPRRPHLAALARGEDHARGRSARTSAVSIGHEETFDDDLDDKGELAVILLDQADRVAARLRASDLRATSWCLIVKYDDFRRITRRTTLDAATSDGGVLARTAIELLRRSHRGPQGQARAPVGVAATSIESRDAPRQLRLDEAARAGRAPRRDARQYPRQVRRDAVARGALVRRRRRVALPVRALQRAVGRGRRMTASLHTHRGVHDDSPVRRTRAHVSRRARRLRRLRAIVVGRAGVGAHRVITRHAPRHKRVAHRGCRCRDHVLVTAARRRDRSAAPTGSASHADSAISRKPSAASACDRQ